MLRITPYTPEQREELLQLAMRSWEPVFPLTQSSVPPFVYESFYPNGWRERKWHDLAQVLDDEPETVVCDKEARHAPCAPPPPLSAYDFRV